MKTADNLKQAMFHGQSASQDKPHGFASQGTNVQSMESKPLRTDHKMKMNKSNFGFAKTLFFKCTKTASSHRFEIRVGGSMR